MKKKRVLKSWVKETLLFIACGIALFGCFKLLQLQDQYEYNKAIERCGSVENLNTHYTQQGDKYYTCKVEK
jgi:hypothetical protein